MSGVWRFFLASAPVLGVAFIVWAALQGERAILFSRNVYLVLVPVSALGFWIAGHTVRVVASTPLVSISEAKPGRVMLQGTAQVLPDCTPLISTAGRTCVWFRYREKDRRNDGIQTRISSKQISKSGTDYKSSRPFVIDDGSGKCLVLPNGAEITGRNVEDDQAHREMVILPGDKISVLGQFQPFSASAIAQVYQEDQNAPIVLVSNTRQDSLTEDNFARLVQDGQRKLAELESAANRNPPVAFTLPALATISAPRYGGIYLITTQNLESDTSIYGLLSYVDLVVLLGAAVMAAYRHFAAH